MTGGSSLKPGTPACAAAPPAPSTVRAMAGAGGATGAGPRGGGGVDTGQPRRTRGAATPMAPGGSGGWSQISAWRLAVGGEDEPTMVPAAVPVRGGEGTSTLPRAGRPARCSADRAPGNPGRSPGSSSCPSPGLRAVCEVPGAHSWEGGARVQTQPSSSPHTPAGGSRGCRGWWDE